MTIRPSLNSLLPKPPCLKRLSNKEIASAYARALQSGAVAPGDTSAIFYSTAVLNDRLDALEHAFPENTMHAVAIKANSAPPVLRCIVERGMGLEAASLEEVLLARDAGAPPDRIVFDSPVKTREEIAFCHEQLPGMVLNANCLEELERYPDDFSGRLGLRINPLVGSDAHGLFRVADRGSKFGVPISREREILEACVRYPSISGLHVHVGSGIRDFTPNVEAVTKLLLLAGKIAEARQEKGIGKPLTFIDIGGGIDFESYEGPHSPRAYAAQLRKTGIFERYRTITEFGRFVHTDAGFTVSRVEYVVPGPTAEDALTAFIHVGADLFLRKVYAGVPESYPCSVIPQGAPSRSKRRYNVAGPLCFAGDYLYHNLELPELRPGDLLAIHRTGANTLSMWSAHCSRTVPRLVMC